MDTIHLTVKYASYTFLDKSTELLPVAKSVFESIATELAGKHGRARAVSDPSKFYDSVAYNGISGVSTVLVSNDVTFTDVPEVAGTASDATKPADIVQKLEALKRAFDSGLISKEEYESKRKEILDRY